MNRREFVRNSVIAGLGASVAPGLVAGQTPPGERIGVGLVGAGGRGQDLLQKAQQVPGVEIAAVCDAYAGRAERARARTGGRAAIHRDYRDLLASPGIDAVIIASPDHWHRRMVLDALAAGKDVYVEKPLTFAIEEGQEIADAVRRTRRVLQVGSQGMSSQTVAKAREIVQSGRLGQITLVRATYNRNTAEGAWVYPIPPDASPRTVDWEAFLGPAPKRPFSLERFFRWRCYWDYSGGIATDLFVHLVTSMHHMLSARMPARVIASGDLYRWKDTREVPDTVNAILTYPDGFTVNLSSTFNSTGSDTGIEILGTDASLVLRGPTLTLVPETGYENNRWVVASWPEALERAYYADPAVQAKETPATWKPEARRARETWSEQGQDSTTVHLARFFECVRNRTTPAEDADVGGRAAAVAHLINRSIREGKPIEWDAVRDSARRAG